MAEKEIVNGESFKYEYSRKGQPITSENHLLELVRRRSCDFPHINGGELTVHGKLGETGMVVTNGHGVIVASVKSPRHIPNYKNGKDISFGGAQCDNHIELSLEKAANGSCQNQAAMIIDSLRHGSLPEISELYTGLAAVGSEPEAWVIKPDGRLADISGGELQMGLNEDSLEPIADPATFLKVRARYIIDRQKRFPGLLIVDTSVLPTGSPLDMRINDAGELGPYIQAVQTRLSEDFFRYSDPLAETLMDRMAQTYGLRNHQELREVKGDMAYWVMAASHASVGLPHRRSGKNAMWIPEQDAIAVADIFNTNLATAAELLMMSSPVIFGETPKIQVAEREIWPRDYRALLRYLMDTTNPSAFILTPEVMHERIIRLITEGWSNTIDRGSYEAIMPDGRVVPVMHGRVRNRMATGEPKNQTGRVEFTGCAASPSLYDELARNCLLQVLTFAAYEALANGQHPIEYFAENYKDQFPNLSRWQEQKSLLVQASLYGYNYGPVRELIQETINFLAHMAKKYPALEPQAKLAGWRLNNLMQPAARSLEEYLSTNQGPISEVMQHEVANGTDPVTLVQKINAFQLAQAEMIEKQQE